MFSVNYNLFHATSKMWWIWLKTKDRYDQVIQIRIQVIVVIYCEPTVFLTLIIHIISLNLPSRQLRKVQCFSDAEAKDLRGAALPRVTVCEIRDSLQTEA